ncbi:MAG: hypothetical protein ACODAQ_02315 [Phycisphaeraceae bacterium]
MPSPIRSPRTIAESPDTHVYRFRHCEVRAELARDYTVTRFPDGTEVPAAPSGDPEQQQTAQRLGYGEDVAAMCREHEILHTWLAERFDLPHSPTLWAVAHDHGEGCAPVWAQKQEEALVLAFQGYLNGRPATPVLEKLVERGHCLADLKDEALRMLRRRGDEVAV